VPVGDVLRPLRDAAGRRVHGLVDRVVAARLPAIVEAEVQRRLDERLPAVRAEAAAEAQAHVAERALRDHRVWGPDGRLEIAPTAHVNDALFNTESGRITVGEHAFFGHGVAVLTGTHDVAQTREARQRAVPSEGRDVEIGPGAWIGTRAMVLGPCRIGADAVVAAGAVVTHDVPDGAKVAGVPARAL
jgi:acetyltransferase-like isoleucine patch superfamily enzyme